MRQSSRWAGAGEAPHYAASERRGPARDNAAAGAGRTARKWGAGLELGRPAATASAPLSRGLMPRARRIGRVQ